MSIFANYKRIKRTNTDHHKPEDRAPEEVKSPQASSAADSSHSAPEEPASNLSRWNSHDTKAKIAEVRKKWRRPSIPAISHVIPHGPKSESPSPQRLVYRPDIEPSAPLAVKEPDMTVKGVPSLKQRPSVRRLRLFKDDSQPPNETSASIPRHCSVSSIQRQRPYPERRTVSSNAVPAESGSPTGLNRVSTIKKTLKRSASVLLPKVRQTWDVASHNIPSRRYEDLGYRNHSPRVH